MCPQSRADHITPSSLQQHLANAAGAAGNKRSRLSRRCEVRIMTAAVQHLPANYSKVPRTHETKRFNQLEAVEKLLLINRAPANYIFITVLSID